MTTKTGAGPLDAGSFRDRALDLAQRDAPLRAVLDDYGMPDFWSRPASFATLVLFVVEQQVSLASAKAVFDRMATALGAVTAETVAAAEDAVLVAAGLTRQKQRYIRLLAEEVVEGRLDLERLATEPDEVVRRSLLALTGIGPWTADVWLLSCLRRPDIWPVGDRALQVGVGEVLSLPEIPAPAELEQLGDRWRPHRAVAARLVWHAYLCKRGRKETEIAGL